MNTRDIFKRFAEQVTTSAIKRSTFKSGGPSLWHTNRPIKKDSVSFGSKSAPASNRRAVVEDVKESLNPAPAPSHLASRFEQIVNKTPFFPMMLMADYRRQFLQPTIEDIDIIEKSSNPLSSVSKSEAILGESGIMPMDEYKEQLLQSLQPFIEDEVETAARQLPELPRHLESKVQEALSGESDSFPMVPVGQWPKLPPSIPGTMIAHLATMSKFWKKEQKGTKGEFEGVQWTYLGRGIEGNAFKIGSLKHNQPVSKLKIFSLQQDQHFLRLDPDTESFLSEKQWDETWKGWKAAQGVDYYQNAAYQFKKIRIPSPGERPIFAIQSEYLSRNKKNKPEKRIVISERPGKGTLREGGYFIPDPSRDNVIQGVTSDLGYLSRVADYPS